MVEKRCVNPFFHRIEIPPDFYVTIALGTIFLVPLRLFFGIILFVISAGLANIYNFILSFIDKKANTDKFHYWRIIFKSHLSALFRLVFYISGFYKINIVQKGDDEKEKDAPILVLAPHTSLFDVLAGFAFGVPSSVAKADIIDIPLFGSIFKLCDPVLVERDNKNSRQDVFKKVKEAIKYSKIIFFPEGTCSNKRAFLQFKNGAFRFGYPVIPIAVQFNQFDWPDTLSWTWDGPSTLLSVWLTLARWRTDLKIIKLPVYYPSEAEKSDPDLYASNVAKVIAKELRLPSLFYSFDDVRYLKYNFFRSSTCVKLLKLCDKIRQCRLDSNGKVFKPFSLPEKSNQINKNIPETLFTTFLYNYIDEINQNLDNLNLSLPLEEEKLINLLNAESVLNNSSSLKELMLCLKKQRDKVGLIHLKIIFCLIDLRYEDLWERLRFCYDAVKKIEKSSEKMQFENLRDILWLALNLDDIDQDEEIKSVNIKSFDDLKELLINYYNFALKENAGSIYFDEASKGQSTQNSKTK